VTLLVGDAGVGKSTLVADLVREIRGRGVRMLVGRAAAHDNPPPFSLLQSAIESARDDPLLRSDDDPHLAGGPMLIGFVPGLGEEAFPAPVGIEGRLVEVLAGADPRAVTSRDQLLSEITDRFLEITRHGPTVLVLEDIYRADPSSLTAVEFFVRELRNRPLWVLATTRPNPSLSSTGRATLEKFENSTGAHRVILRPMTSSETADFLRTSDPTRELTPEEVARQYSETGGNPFLLKQLHPRTPLTVEGRERSTTEDSLLQEEEQELLDFAAVLGPEFPFTLLQRASEREEERLAEEVDRLVERGLLFERPGEILGFPDDRLREEAYNALPERQRRYLHLRAGTALEALGPADPSRVYTLAHHFYLGREGQKSVRYNRLAAEIAERSLAPEAAWDYLSHALESHRALNPEDFDEEAELVLAVARITEELGVLKEAEAMLREFFERAEGNPRLSPGHRATLEVFLARVLTDQGDLPEAGELAQKVLDNPDLNDQFVVQVGGHHQLGMVLYYDGRYPEALAHHTEEVELARKVGNPLLLLRARVWRVASLEMMGETAKAIEEAREVTVERDRLGSVRESAQAHLFLGDILADPRSPPADRRDAVGQYAEAIRYGRQAKDPRRVGWAFYKTAELLREEGRLGEAEEAVRQACDILGQIGDHVGLSVSLKVRGQIAMDRSDLDQAEADLLEAHRLLRGTNHTLEEIDVLLRLAQLCSGRGERDGAREKLSELVKMDLPRARPDLLPEFEKLRRTLAQG